MTAWEAKHKAALAEWKNRVAACRSSGLTVREWCENEQISTKSYYRWERKVLDSASLQLSEPKEFPAVLPATSETTTQTKNLSSPVFAELSVLPQFAEECQPEIVAQIHMGTIILEVHANAKPDFIAALCRALSGC